MWISIILWLFTKGTDLSHLCITQYGKIFLDVSFIFFLKLFSKSSHTKWSKYHISSSEPGSSKSIVWALWQPTRCRKGMHDCISFISGSYHDITAKDETMRAILLLVIIADYRSVRKIWSETKVNEYDLFWVFFRELHKGFADAALCLSKIQHGVFMIVINKKMWGMGHEFFRSSEKVWELPRWHRLMWPKSLTSWIGTRSPKVWFPVLELVVSNKNCWLKKKLTVTTTERKFWSQNPVWFILDPLQWLLQLFCWCKIT